MKIVGSKIEIRYNSPTDSAEGNSIREVIEDVENFTGSSTGFPYWMIIYTFEGEKIRRFIHIDRVVGVAVYGEEELIQKARTKSSQVLTKELGLDE